MEFAAGLPTGLDTPCGERGVRLSGGQRQRVALARAFLRDPGLLVLDEPTSALDAAAEDRIRRTMKDLMSGRTAVVISHRFSLVRDLDLILVLVEGRIVEPGTHAELIELKGTIRRVVRFAAGGRRESMTAPLTFSIFERKILCLGGISALRRCGASWSIGGTKVNKRIYTKPNLTVRTIALGVFGTYGDTGPGGGGSGPNNGPHPGKRPGDLLRDSAIGGE